LEKTAISVFRKKRLKTFNEKIFLANYLGGNRQRRVMLMTKNVKNFVNYWQKKRLKKGERDFEQRIIKASL
jgi:hypothetical protein